MLFGVMLRSWAGYLSFLLCVGRVFSLLNIAKLSSIRYHMYTKKQRRLCAYRYTTIPA